MKRQREWQCPFQNLVNMPLSHINTLSHPRVLRRIRQIFLERATCGKRGHSYHAVAQWQTDFWREWTYAVCGAAYFDSQRWYALAAGYTIDMPRFVLIPKAEWMTYATD